MILYIIIGLFLISDICFIIAYIRTVQTTNDRIVKVVQAYTNVVSSALLLDTYVRSMSLYEESSTIQMLHDQLYDAVGKLPNNATELFGK